MVDRKYIGMRRNTIFLETKALCLTDGITKMSLKKNLNGSGPSELC